MVATNVNIQVFGRQRANFSSGGPLEGYDSSGDVVSGLTEQQIDLLS